MAFLNFHQNEDLGKHMSKRIEVLQLQADYHENSHNYSDLAEQIAMSFPRSRYRITSAFLRGKPEKDHPTSCADQTVYFDFSKNSLGGIRLTPMRRIYDYCRRNKFEVIICNRYKQVSLMLHLNRLLKVPVCIGISHGLGEYEHFWRRQRARLLIDDSWAFVGVSQAVKDYLLTKECGFTEKNTVAIDNAFDISKAEELQYTKQNARAILGLPQGALVIGAAGRLVRVKGHIYLIKAFANIANSHPDAVLAIIGEGKERIALEEAIEQSGIKNRIYLLGFVASAKRYIRAFDIWTMPSLTEGLPLSLLEGMSGRLPFIASRIPSMIPLIEGAGGLSVPPANTEMLAKALDLYLLMSSGDREKKGIQAYEYLCRNHEIERYRSQYLRLVENSLTAYRKRTNA